MQPYRAFAYVMAGLLLLPASTSAEKLVNPLVGIWRLVSVETRKSDGTVSSPYGDTAAGLLVYDAPGKMSAHLMNIAIARCGTMDRRKCPDKEARAAFDNYLGYWGSYELLTEGNTVIHHVEGASHPDWVGTAQKRYFEISENRIVITTPPMMIRGVEVVVVVVGERVQSQ